MKEYVKIADIDVDNSLDAYDFIQEANEDLASGDYVIAHHSENGTDRYELLKEKKDD